MTYQSQAKWVIGSVRRAGRIDAPIDRFEWDRVGQGLSWADIASRFRRWREGRETWAALRELDDRQLKEFRIGPRPPELSKSRFPDLG